MFNEKISPLNLLVSGTVAAITVGTNYYLTTETYENLEGYNGILRLSAAYLTHISLLPYTGVPIGFTYQAIKEIE